MGVNGVYGFSGSGMDVESLVKMGMMGHQKRLDKYNQTLQKLQWTKNDYQSLRDKITTFSSSNLSQYKRSNNMNAKSVESSSSAVKVSANSNAVLMNHKVDVAALSSNAYLISSGEIKRYGSDENSIQLKDILFQNLTLSGDGKTVESGKSLPYTPSTVNSSGYEVTSGTSSSNNAFSFIISDGATKEKDENGAETSELKKVEINFSYEELANGATLNDLVSKINNAGLNIKASYDSVQDKFSLYNNKGGDGNTIKIESSGLGDTNSANAGINGSTALAFFYELGLKQSVNGELTNDSFEWQTANTADTTQSSSFEAKGTSGSIWVDGMRYETTDNKVTVGGITYTALNTTTTETKDSTTQKYTLDSTANSAAISVSQDTDTIIDKVKSFVEDYNKLLAELYEKYDEKPNSDYKPLTQSQKDQMKEDQIEKWEKKAKAGMLYHDQTLGKIIMNMRDSIAESVEGIDSKYNSAFSLGISTTGLKGQLVLDEDKLKKALAEDPDAVYNVFAKLDNKDLNNSAKSGMAQRLGDIFTEATKKIKDVAGSSEDVTEDSEFNNKLRSLQTTISNFKKLMTSFENALYKKYDAMETAISRLNSQYGLVASYAGQQ